MYLCEETKSTLYQVTNIGIKCNIVISLRAGSLIGKGGGAVSAKKSGARKSEPARELLIFEFPAFADERSDPIG